MKKIINWFKEKELRILLPLCAFAFICFAGNLYYQSYTLNNTAKHIGSGAVTFQRLHIVNTSTDVVTVGFYDFVPTGTIITAPTFTTTPKYLYPLNASANGYISQIQPLDWNGLGSKTVLSFTANCWVRAWKGSITSSSVSPTDSVYIDLDF